MYAQSILENVCFAPHLNQELNVTKAQLHVSEYSCVCAIETFTLLVILGALRVFLFFQRHNGRFPGTVSGCENCEQYTGCYSQNGLNRRLCCSESPWAQWHTGTPRPQRGFTPHIYCLPTGSSQAPSPAAEVSLVLLWHCQR